MGRFFTERELRLGHVPQPESFATLLSFILSSARREPAVMAATFCGSAIRMDKDGAPLANVRSDLDLVVIYHFAHRAAIRENLFSRWYEMADRHYVPLNLVAYDNATALNGGHWIKPTFRQEIAWAERNGGAITGSTLDFLAVLNENTDDALEYGRKKGDTFGKLLASWPVLTEMERCKGRERTMKGPFNLARKTLEVRGIPCAGLSKPELIQAFADNQSRTLAGILHSILTVDRHYTREVTLLAENFDGARHARILAQVDASIPEAEHFVLRILN